VTVTGDPGLLRLPVVPALSETLPPSRLKLLFPAYAALLVAGAVSVLVRRHLFGGRTSPPV